jgi:cytochrome b6-f complex iron-sulfur subunit/menaquinol-cytochrome c reductase iron-sulfur subunit
MAGPLQNHDGAGKDEGGAGALSTEKPNEERAPRHEGKSTGRRGALKAFVAVGGAAYAGAILVPAASMLAPKGGDGAGKTRFIRVARLAQIPVGDPRRVVIVGDEQDAYTITRDEQLGSVWLLRDGDKVTAFSTVCPHLGCLIDLDADHKSFSCPCHTSKFSLAGDALSGPCPRGMDPLNVRIVDGFVEVDFRRYRQGIAERKEVG